jgi:hypothetical protein
VAGLLQVELRADLAAVGLVGVDEGQQVQRLGDAAVLGQRGPAWSAGRRPAAPAGPRTPAPPPRPPPSVRAVSVLPQNAAMANADPRAG